MRVKSGIFGWHLRGEYILVRADGGKIPKKDLDMYESAPQLFNALRKAIELIDPSHREEKQEMLKVIEQCMGGKKTNNFKDKLDIIDEDQ